MRLIISCRTRESTLFHVITSPKETSFRFRFFFLVTRRRFHRNYLKCEERDEWSNKISKEPEILCDTSHFKLSRKLLPLLCSDLFLISRLNMFEFPRCSVASIDFEETFSWHSQQLKRERASKLISFRAAQRDLRICIDTTILLKVFIFNVYS